VRLDPAATAFLGVPRAELGTLDADVAIVGIPFGWAYPRPGATSGCAAAPTAIRARSQRLARFRDHWDFDTGGPMLPPDGLRVVDLGDVPGSEPDGAANGAAATEAVAACLARGAVPICLGGDDSITIPALRAFAGHGPVTVLQVDAHLDFRDEVDGVRDGYSSPMRRASEMAHVARTIQVGLRGVGSARGADVEAARAAGNLLVTAAELRERGVAWVLDQLSADERVVVAFDGDGLDPAVFPAASALAPGGLTYDEADALLGGIGGRLAGATFTEYVPALDVNELSALVIARLAIRLAGGVGGHHHSER
jgi:agmatinase